MRILAVDDEEISLSSIKRLLNWRGYKDVETCRSGAEAIRRLRMEDFDIVLLDLLMPEVDGLTVLETVKPYLPQTEFIILTAVDDLSTTVRAIRTGAYDYLVKPVDNELLILTIQRAFERRGLLNSLAPVAAGRVSDTPEAFTAIVTKCPRMRSLLAYAQVMARSGNPVLITGESGTGKELVAQGIHRAGPSPEGPFVAVNVSAIPTTMFETQFFGHARGAFTGAESSYRGFFEQADGGTLFLDEVSEMSLGMQVKLLRVLQEREITRVGGSDVLKVDVRIIAATNKDLRQEIGQGRFRDDLFYRLNVVNLVVPPLRERREDIPLLAQHFLAQFAEKNRKGIKGFTPRAMDGLLRHEWPGNVRELMNAVERGVVMARSEWLGEEDLALTLPDGTSPVSPEPSEETGLTVEGTSLDELERAAILKTLEGAGGNKSEAARRLGITRRTLHKKLKQYGLM